MRILPASCTALVAIIGLTSYLPARADDVSPQPINLILSPARGGGLIDPAPEILGHAGEFMLFTATSNGKSRRMYTKAVTHPGKGFNKGLDFAITPDEIGTKSFPLKLGPAVKGELDNYVAEYSESNFAYTRAVAYFHEQGKGLWRFGSEPYGVVFLKKTDTSGTDPAQMLSDLSIIDEQGKYPDDDKKEYNYPIALFAAPGSKVGKELWLSDGTPAGTKVLDNIDPNVDGSGRKETGEGSFPQNISAYYPDLSGGRAYFVATTGSGWDVFEATRNVNAGKRDPLVTVRGLFQSLEGIQLADMPKGLTASSQGVTFSLPTNSQPNGAIFGYDPNNPNSEPQVLSSTDMSPGDFFFQKYCHYRDALGAEFSGLDGGNGRQPFIAGADLGEEFVDRLADGNNISKTANPTQFTVGDNTLFFVSSPAGVEHLYRSNGTTDESEDMGTFTNIHDITPVVERFADGDGNGGAVYFVANDPGTGTPALWQTYTFEGEPGDDSTATPFEVLTAQGHKIFNPTSLTRLVSNGYLYLFFVCDGTGTEFATTTVRKQTVPIGHQVWYTGSFVNNNPQ